MRLNRAFSQASVRVRRQSRFFFTIFFLFLGESQAQSKNILVVGDSLTCGPFGAQVVKNLVKVPETTVTMYCAVSSSPGHWINGKKPRGHKCNTCVESANEKGPHGCRSWFNSKAPDEGMMGFCEGGSRRIPKFSEILEKGQYDEVVVALGTNSLWSPQADQTYSEMVRLMKQSNVPNCSWIGPPHYDPTKGKEPRIFERNLNSFYDSLQEKVAGPSGCTLIDSRDTTANPESRETWQDGVHRNNLSGRKWADAIMNPSGFVPTASGQPAVR